MGGAKSLPSRAFGPFRSQTTPNVRGCFLCVKVKEMEGVAME